MKVTVIAHPNSKRPRIEEDILGKLNVFVNEPPIDGRTNQAITLALAKYLKVKSYQLTIVTGETSKHKVFEIKP